MEEKRDIRNSNFLKIISYISISIAIGMLVLNLICLYVTENQRDYSESQSYYKTAHFSNFYQNQIERILSNADSINNTNWDYNWENYELPYQNEQGEKIYLQQYSSSYEFFQYLVVNRQTKEMYTNIVCTDKTDSLEEIKGILTNHTMLYWNYENKNVFSNIENLKLENLPHNSYMYQRLQRIENIDIYTAVNPTAMELGSSNQFTRGKFLYDVYNQINKIPYAVVTPISLILLLTSIAYLTCSLGKKKYYEGIYLNWVDKIPLEILLFITIFAFIFGLQITFGTSYHTIQRGILGISCGVLLLYFMASLMLTTIVKRIKARKLIKNTILYQIFSKIKNMINNIYEGLQLNSRIILQYIGVTILILILLLFTLNNVFGILMLVIFWFYLLVRLCKITKQYAQIQQAIQAIYEGKTDIALEPAQFKGELNQIAIYLNNIADGLSKAVEESLKSERLKTELITNVSHDIKTPLTSIINYIDLLQKEKIDNTQVNEYLKILDYKSQRLKKLTEDLIEASKVTSGNVALKLEKIAVKELLQQAIGEFQDKFDEKGLKILFTVPQEEVYIQADSRYIYRVIENLFSNVYKYTQDNTRVYIDVAVQNKKVNLQIKNISKEKLNISADELMQRFVRGDKSRTTEGSGLGLSISESLTKLLDGEFKIYIDGDLFKVEVIFKIT